jgi:hypothetical protein
MACVCRFSDDAGRPDVRRNRPAVFTYARFELYLAAHPEAYTPNHMLGPGPGRFFLVNAALSSRFADALDAAGIACTVGATVTTDAPYRTTPEEIRVHRAGGARSLEMEAAALFAATIGWLAR